MALNSYTVLATILMYVFNVDLKLLPSSSAKKVQTTDESDGKVHMY